MHTSCLDSRGLFWEGPNGLLVGQVTPGALGTDPGHMHFLSQGWRSTSEDQVADITLAGRRSPVCGFCWSWVSIAPPFRLQTGEYAAGSAEQHHTVGSCCWHFSTVELDVDSDSHTSPYLGWHKTSFQVMEKSPGSLRHRDGGYLTLMVSSLMTPLLPAHCRSFFHKAHNSLYFSSLKDTGFSLWQRILISQH